MGLLGYWVERGYVIGRWRVSVGLRLGGWVGVGWRLGFCSVWSYEILVGFMGMIVGS